MNFVDWPALRSKAVRRKVRLSKVEVEDGGKSHHKLPHHPTPQPAPPPPTPTPSPLLHLPLQTSPTQTPPQRLPSTSHYKPYYKLTPPHLFASPPPPTIN